MRSAGSPGATVRLPVSSRTTSDSPVGTGRSSVPVGPADRYPHPVSPSRAAATAAAARTSRSAIGILLWKVGGPPLQRAWFHPLQVPGCSAIGDHPGPTLVPRSGRAPRGPLRPGLRRVDHHAAAPLPGGELRTGWIRTPALQHALDQRLVHAADQVGLVLCHLVERAVAQDGRAAGVLGLITDFGQ